MKNIIEIIWFGRGGQGVVTAAQIAADSAFKKGFIGINVVPSFGAERRGAPVEAYLRVANEPIVIYSNITKADILVVLDDSLIHKINRSYVKPNETILIINTSNKKKIEQLKNSFQFKKIVFADVLKVAEKLSLKTSENIIINTPLLGVFIKGTELFELENLKSALFEKFNNEKIAALNFQAAKETFEITDVINCEK